MFYRGKWQSHFPAADNDEDKRQLRTFMDMVGIPHDNAVRLDIDVGSNGMRQRRDDQIWDQ